MHKHPYLAESEVECVQQADRPASTPTDGCKAASGRTQAAFHMLHMYSH